MPYIATVL